MSTPLDLTDGIIKNPRALVYQRKGDQLLFLLTIEPGLTKTLTVPGGCKDLGDATLEAAIRRELREELSLTSKSYVLRPTNIKRTYQSLYLDPKSDRFGKPVEIYLFLAEYNGAEPIVPESTLQGVLWLDEAGVLAQMQPPHMRDIFQEGVRLIEQEKI